MLLSALKSMRTLSLLLITMALLSPLWVAAQFANDASISSISTNKVDNTPKSIAFSAQAAYKAADAQQVFAKYLGTDGENSKMVFRNTVNTKSGLTTDRYTQYIKGIKAEHGTFTVTTKEGKIQFMTGNYYPYDPTMSPAPSIGAAAAFNKAKAFIGANQYMWEIPAAEARLKKIYHKADTSYLPQGRLVWVEDLKSAVNDHKLHLAWAFDIYAAAPVSRNIVYVDANTGDILFANNRIHNTAAANRTKYSGVVTFETSYTGTDYILFDSTRGNGVYTMSANYDTTFASLGDITSTTNFWPVLSSDTQALDAHWGAEKVYDYFLTEQGRLSWDGMDGMLLSIVHMNDASGGVSVPFSNAYWDGSQMVYGDGTGSFLPLTSLDVAAHEIGHGVCQATSDLVYSYESGAMNEGFSDCWAATIENWANPYETDRVAKQVWKIGEEIRPGSPLRSMDNPLLQNDPATYGGTYWINTSLAACPTPTSANDQCGVHTNSGVLNHWYYFLVTGGTGTNDLGTAYSVVGIGWTDAATILYNTELVLGNTDNYADCRVASINVARSIFGPCSAQEEAVTNAWHAVGVGSTFVSCTPQIGFNVTTLNTTEKGGSATTCPASRSINIGLRAFGNPITGGTPVVNVVVAGGTAVSGVDYSLSGTSLSFAPGDTTTHFVTLTINDNGAVNDDKTLSLAFTLAAMGSTAGISATNDTMLINIYNDDSVPTIGRREYHTLNAGTSVTSNLTSAFPGANTRGHSQFLLDATEMSGAGVRAGVPISQIAFDITRKYSTGPFVNYTISMGNTSAGNLASGYATPVSAVFSGNHTTNAGWDSINFTTPFVWDGVSNVAVEICFGANASAYSNNDQMAGIDNSPYIVTNRNGNSSGSTSGCSLAWSGSGTGTARPVMRFMHIIPPTSVETAAGSTKAWDVKTGTEVYYYTPTADTNVIAGTDNPTNDLGCVSATVTQAGVGFTAASFITGNRSRKEVTITPTTAGATTTYDVHFYMTTTELNSVSPSSLYLVRTTAATDAGITASNTVITTPTLTIGTTYVDFKATYTGFGRYFLTDNTFCTAPTATITAGGATSFCAGGNVVLSAPTGTGYTYQWQLGGVNISGATARNYTASTGGAYTVIVTSGTGCNATSAPTTVTILTAYAAPITGATGVCLGSTALVTDSTAGGTWSTSNAAVVSISSTGTLYGVSAGTATITYTFTNACGTTTRTASISVSTPSTVAAISGTLTACPGTTVSLTSSTSGGVWTSSNSAIATVNSTGNVTAVGSGTATISYGVTNAFGCVSYATATFTGAATPTATITPAGSTTLCLGASVVLNATAGTGYTYQWQVGGVNIAGATASTYTASASGSYGVLVTGTGCTGSATPVTVTVSGSLSVVPAISLATTPSTTVCTGTGVVSFTPTAVNGGSAPAYTWYLNGTEVSTATAYSYTPANGDVIACKLTSNAACAFPDTAIATVTMTVNPYVTPVVSINAIPTDTVCEGATGAFAANPSFGGTAPSYTWNKNGTDVYTGPVYYYLPTNGDVLICKMRSNYACRLIDDVQSAPLTVTVVPVTANAVTITASGTSIVVGTSVTFTATTTGTGIRYQWLINNIAIPGATGATFTSSTLSNGQVVTCRVSSTDRCVTPTAVTSAGITIAVSTGVQQSITLTDALVLEPNPNTGNFRVKGNLYGANDGVVITVKNMLGQIVFSTKATVTNNQLNENVVLNDKMASGIYITTVTNITTGFDHVFRVVIGK